ncbi:MAG: cisplatin damage response ATP-dependent DNA ligase [Bacteroidia bacterium]|nr:cisplatin damage response ATP-dependent DNA ligase [Bacteroidia bacterium]
MQFFCKLVDKIGNTSDTDNIVSELIRYFEKASDSDKIGAIALLSGKRPKRLVTSGILKHWAVEVSEIPQWLFEHCYQMVDNPSEAISLLIPEPKSIPDKGLDYWLRYIHKYSYASKEEKKIAIQNAWSCLSPETCYIFNKLVTGSFRTAVTQKSLTQSLSILTGVEEHFLAYKMNSKWDPKSISFPFFTTLEASISNSTKPYAFCLARTFEDYQKKSMGEISDWLVERQLEGIRVQLIKRNGEIFIWNRDLELISDQYPELLHCKEILTDGTVMDGQLACITADRPFSYNLLKSRIGKKNVTKKLLLTAPVSFIAYDILEYEGKDIRSLSLQRRRKILEQTVSESFPDSLLISEVLLPASWKHADELRLQSRTFFSSGLILKRKSSAYSTGRGHSDWWKWRTQPLSLDAVLLYVMKAPQGKTSSNTEYTLGVWNQETLIPITKTSSGLTFEEEREIATFVKNNTIEKFGPVKSVKTELVFSIEFKNIQSSKRHKSGVLLISPKISQWQKEKKPKEASTLKELKMLL